MQKERVNKMNDNAYIGRICTDLVLNKKATDDNERQWTRFRLAVPRSDVCGLADRIAEETEKKIQIFLTALLLHLLLRISVNTQKKVDAFMSVVRTGKTTLKKMV